MSTTTLATLDERFAKIDSVASNFLSLNATGASSFALAIHTANAMGQLRELLNAETMKPILQLMNSPLGFLTDKDPKRPQWKGGREVHPDPYALEVVRDCVIEATLRGIPIVGNNFNIIGSRTYVTKEGFGTLLKKVAGFSDLKITPGVPKLVGENGALVEMEATWRKDGKEDGLRRTIPVRVNSGMGTDAILGKAERKVKCAVYNQVTGSELSDGDAEEAALAAAKPANVTNVTTSPTTVAKPPVGAPTKSKPEPAAPAVPAGTTTSKPASDPGPFDSGEQASQVPSKATPAEGVANLIKATPGVTENGVLAFCRASGECDETAQVLEDLHESVLISLVQQWAQHVDALKAASALPVATPADADLVAKVREAIATENIPEEKLVDWCIGKRFCGPSAKLENLPESRLLWIINNLAKHKDAILAGPKAARK